MKRLLAVLCFVPVGFCLVAFAYELLTDTPTILNRFIVVAFVVITYELVKFGINKIHALGARLWRGEKNGYIRINGKWYPADVKIEGLQEKVKEYPKVVLKDKPLLDRMNNYRFQFQERFGRMPTDEEQKEAFKHMKHKEDSCSTKS